ncbi:glycosyltransferase [Luteimonas soli]|uniref:Glycosyltransferase n=1 Tax=Luteimonas soli TaxID=1648966 RepID=A0ABV7XMR1_9GAMM
MRPFPVSDPPVTFFMDVPTPEIDAWRRLRPDETPQRLVLGEHYWIALTFARLRAAGMAVHLDNRLPASGAVLFYAGDKRAAWRQAQASGSRALLVAVRSDRNPVGFADVEIVQNAASADGHRSLHVPHWPQPGLVPRDPVRGDRPRTLLFPGTPQNLHSGFGDARWRQFLDARGLAFRCHGAGDGAQRAWPDWHDVDLLLAVRASGSRLVRNKPGWKLFNAWLAGVPAILGPESGYRELRQGPLDYLEVDGPEHAMAAIDRLLDEPALYQAMADNGLARGQAFSTEATLSRWRLLVDDELVPRAAAQLFRPAQAWKRGAREAGVRLRRVLSGAA